MRSGYSEDCDMEQRDFAMWRGRVASAMRGKRGQKLLRDCLAALDAMPEKRLIAEHLVDDGDVCLLGACGRMRKLPEIETLDPEEHEMLGNLFDVAPCLIQEIEYENDEGFSSYRWIGNTWVATSPEERFIYMRDWLLKNIAPATEAT